MAKIVPYIFTTPGVAKKQMQYYADSIGAKIKEIIPFNQEVMKQFAPDKTFTDEQLAESVMHGELLFGGNSIYIACAQSEQTYNDAIQIFLGFEKTRDNEVAKAKQIFETFSKDGKEVMPLAEQFWGDTFGIVEDKFGIKWQIMITEFDENK